MTHRLEEITLHDIVYLYPDIAKLAWKMAQSFLLVFAITYGPKFLLLKNVILKQEKFGKKMLLRKKMNHSIQSISKK